METSFATGAAKVLIAEESAAVRKLLSDCIRSLGFLEITVVATGKDVFNALEHDDCDWIIMPTFHKQSVTAFHILKVICEIPHLRRVRMSLLVDKDEEPHLAPAFHYGLLSWHTKNYVQTHIQSEMTKLTGIMKHQNWMMPLVAAEYFREYMSARKSFDSLLEVEKYLLDLFPGSLALLLKYGETQIRSGKTEAGIRTLQQACLIDERAKKLVDSITEKYTDLRFTGNAQGGPQNVLGIKSCVLIDPDTAVLGSLKKLLAQAGVPQIETFENGEEAWQWLSTHPEPDLLLHEWRLPGLPGPLLLQRIRQHGFINVPVNILSSVIKPEESHLLREFGVANVIAKPFASQSLFKSLVWTIQQHVYPTEQNSFQQKIKRLLQSGALAEAEQLKPSFLGDPRIKTSCKKTIEAHFAFAYGSYRQGRDLAMEALRLQGDALCLLNLIGKCLLKIGDYAAAAKIFEKAHSMSTMNIENLCLLALAQNDCNKKNEAKAAIDRALEIDSGNQLIVETTCQIALLQGDDPRAKALMDELTSVHSVLAYMNNRAVSLTRSGRFEAGIELYKRTRDAIPSKLPDAKDAVSYNLGLAYARYGELKKATDSLATTLERKESKVQRKSLSLMKRLKESMEQNVPLAFYEVPPEEPSQNPASEADVEVQMAASGELCLNGIYLAPTSEQSHWSPLFDSYPRYIEKSSRRAVLVQEGR